jgi:hypothetical protein
MQPSSVPPDEGEGTIPDETTGDAPQAEQQRPGMEIGWRRRAKHMQQQLTALGAGDATVPLEQQWQRLAGAFELTKLTPDLVKAIAEIMGTTVEWAERIMKREKAKMTTALHPKPAKQKKPSPASPGQTTSSGGNVHLFEKLSDVITEIRSGARAVGIEEGQEEAVLHHVSTIVSILHDMPRERPEEPDSFAGRVMQMHILRCLLAREKVDDTSLRTAAREPFDVPDDDGNPIEITLNNEEIDAWMSHALDVFLETELGDRGGFLVVIEDPRPDDPPSTE